MKKLITVVIASAFAMAGASTYAADSANTASDASAKDSGRTAAPAAQGKQKKAKLKAIQAKGGPCVPGAGDPAATATQAAQGGDVKCVEDATAKTPRDAQPTAQRAKK